MDKAKVMSDLAAAIVAAGCTQTAGAPAPVTAGPMDANSVTVFTLALQPGSITGCIMGDSSMNRPVTLTVSNGQAELLTEGGIHYSLIAWDPTSTRRQLHKDRADLWSSPSASRQQQRPRLQLGGDTREGRTAGAPGGRVALARRMC
jgi:hypothetical protein